jgi:Fe-S-cluster-containing hydrogenase component 2
MKLVIEKDRCPQNHKCPAVKACPVDALSQQGMAVPVVDVKKCISCGKCAKVCPTGALHMEDESN